MEWIHKYVDASHTCSVSTETSIDNFCDNDGCDETIHTVMRLQGDTNARVQSINPVDRLGLSEGQLVAILLTGWAIPIATVTIIYKYNVLNLFHIV